MRLLVLLLCAGCADGEALPLGTWEADIEGRRQTVTLPVVLPLPDRPLDYTLFTEVPLPDAWRGRPLTLVIPFLRASATLRANDEEAVALEGWLTQRYRHPGWHAWRIPARLTDRARLPLSITVEHRSLYSARLDAEPRLSTGLHGDRIYVAASSFNELTALSAIVLIALIGFIYLVSFLFDRRHQAHFWFALQSACAGVILAYHLGFTQTLGVSDAVLVNLMRVLAGYASLAFTRAHFGLSPPGRRWKAALALFAVGALASWGSFAGPRYGAAIGLGFIGLTTGGVVAVLWKQRRRFDAALLLSAWTILYALLGVEGALTWGGNHALAVLGLRVVPLAYCLFVMVQAIALGRERMVAFREVELLNQELRRQIADRARQLSEALARLHGAEPPRALEPGAVIEGRYRVLDRLGAGGMGAVYRVERLADGKHLALKVLTGVADKEALARFAREAQIAAELHHQNLVSVLDIDVSRSGMLFIVMELVGGPTLSAERARFGDARWALPLLRQIAAALAAMHARGIVHRDLKPSNVLLDGNTAKVADFGIASLAGGDATVTLTRSGALMGTPVYMAPESDRGRPAADIWSFGVLAHELCTGQLPFSEPPVVAHLQSGAMPTPRLAPSLEPPLRQLIDACLSLDPAARPTAAEITSRIA